MAARAPAPPDPGGPISPPGGGARGHAYHAEQARRALGVSIEPRLAAVPFPVVHAALAVAACAAAVALRPGAVGLRGTVIGVCLLCAATAVILVTYDRLVYPPGVRPQIEAIALPLAALGAFSLVLAGTIDMTTRLVAAAVTVVTFGGLPHLGGLRATGREGWAVRFLRDAAAIAVLVPVLLASTSVQLPLPLRSAVVLVGVGLVTLDGLQSEAMRRRHSMALAAAVGVIVSLVMIGVNQVAASPGAAAAAVLMIWYGARGVAGCAVIPPRRWRAALEHAAVVGAALIGLYLVTR
ncbi:MAG TPA: hypothetical protein VEK76_14095 [Candidatus Binatia bacterium]|nr:hypothetical protein [Candidatus Binatia bacterium]